MRTQDRRSVLWGGAAVLLVLVACKKNGSDDLVAEDKAAAAAEAAKHAPRVKAKLEVVRGLAAELKRAPKLQSDAVSLGGARLEVGQRDSKVVGNTVVLFEEELTDPSQAFGNRHLTGTGLLRTCDAIASGQETFVTLDYMPSVAQTCIGLKYAIVIRTSQKVKAKVAADKSSFEPGKRKGEVHFFELEPALKHAGGFRYDLKSSESVTYSGDDPTLEVEEDIDKQLGALLTRKLAAM